MSQAAQTRSAVVRHRLIKSAKSLWFIESASAPSRRAFSISFSSIVSLRNTLTRSSPVDRICICEPFAGAVVCQCRPACHSNSEARFFEKILVNHWILGRERFLIAAGHARVRKFPSTCRQGRAVAAEEKFEGYLLRVRTDCVKLQIAESFRGGFDGALNIKRIAQVVR